MKIAHVCPYSAGACGVWMRVKQEAIEFSKRGYSVQVFSTNHIKGSRDIAPSSEHLEGIKINRFPAKKLGGESFMYWSFEKELADSNPDVIITHNYRHIHNHKSLNVGDKMNSPVFLVTHAPFVEGNITRTRIQTLAVKLYDLLVGPRTIDKFEKIFSISNWEQPYLLKLGAKKEKIVHIPNGIPAYFFTKKRSVKPENKILFLGRISPKKKLETIIESLKHLGDKELFLEIVGPREEEYYESLKLLIKNLGLEKKVKFTDPIYDLDKKIDKLDSASAYVLASKVEGMPQGLIEAMAREMIVVCSNSIAARDIVKDKENGYLFEFDNPKDLARTITLALSEKPEKIKKNAKTTVQKFNWDQVFNKIEKEIMKFRKI